jgi:hypothetical protein
MGIVNAVPIFFGPRHKMSVSPKGYPVCPVCHSLDLSIDDPENTLNKWWEVVEPLRWERPTHNQPDGATDESGS